VRSERGAESEKEQQQMQEGGRASILRGPLQLGAVAAGAAVNGRRLRGGALWEPLWRGRW